MPLRSFVCYRKGGFIAEYNRKGGTLAADSFLVTSFRAKSRNLPCPAVIHVSVKMKIDVFVFCFPAVSRRPFMGLPERSLGCARDDETGSGWFLIRFQIAAIHPLLRCVPLQRVRNGEKCPKDCGERSSRIVAEYNRKGGTLAAGGFLVTSFRAKSRNLSCFAVIHVSVKMKIDVFVFRFPAVSRRPFMGLPERSLGCARDDETGSGWFLTCFQIAAIHPLPSVCPSSKISRSRSK